MPFLINTGVSEGINLAAQGLVAQNFDRQVAIGSSIMVSGTVYYMGVPLKAGQSISTISFANFTGAASMTLGRVGLYSPSVSTSATLLAQSASITNAWTATGIMTQGLSATYSVTSNGLYYVALIAVAGTPPTAWRGNTGAGTLTTPVGSGARPNATQSGQTDLPATATQAATASIAYWVELS